MACGLVAAIVIAQGTVLKAILMTATGVLLGMIGTDTVTGQA
jgi:TctA family transporter